METIQIPAVAHKPRQTMLPLLVVLFLISYVLLTTLVVLQNRTIDRRRTLIHVLFKDNLHTGYEGGIAPGASVTVESADGDSVSPGPIKSSSVEPGSVEPDSVKPGIVQHRLRQPRFL